MSFQWYLFLFWLLLSHLDVFSSHLASFSRYFSSTTISVDPTRYDASLALQIYPH
jgi:hypothetical protein